MIRVVVLGTSGSIPSPQHLPSCLAVKYGGVYLIDACESVQQQMMRYGVSYAKLRAVFLTHLHADHFLGLFGLTQTLSLIGRSEPLLVFGPVGTKKLFTTLFAAKETRPAFPIEFKDVKSGVVLKEQLFDVRAFSVKHNTPAVGYALIEHPHRKFDEAKARAAGIRGRLFTEIVEKGVVTVASGKKVKLESVTFTQEGKKLVFSGDTMPCATLAREAKKADLLVHDSCFTSEHETLAKQKAHSTARQAAEIAKKAGVKKLLLTHFSNRYDEDRSVLLKEAREVFAASELAEEGMELLV